MQAACHLGGLSQRLAHASATALACERRDASAGAVRKLTSGPVRGERTTAVARTLRWSYICIQRCASAALRLAGSVVAPVRMDFFPTPDGSFDARYGSPRRELNFRRLGLELDRCGAAVLCSRVGGAVWPRRDLWLRT
ncbi:hypothetical protein DAEQUDRAFT_369053 [Daedalea quercina L-15889]|uniref:Uncharacterized protein n=1 Tax=Daedalea quercina L-15889 TaxID=1314783 RepID=A0A165PAM9_9APHY|nr:hypothetical protein DAEQUDRAFT_369053 [Daedalea quercina L-15889]